MVKEIGIILVFVVTSSMGFTQSEPELSDTTKVTESIFSILCENGEVADVTLTTDMKQLGRKRFDDEYQEGFFEFINNGDTISCDIKLKARGNSRKKLCTNPPIMLKFSKAWLSEQEFESFHKIKLVNCCKPGEIYEQLLFREYLAYKLYNELTDLSFKVQLLNIHFVDQKKGKKRSRYAFILENEDELCDRMKGRRYEVNALHPETLERKMLTQLDIFQYAIGNTDYQAGRKHNILLFVSQDYNRAVAIPYDMDYSGIVDAPYAIPHSSLKIPNVRTRIYRGYCRSDEEWKEALEIFKRKEPAMLKCIQDYELLNSSDKSYMVNYLKSFFDKLDNPRKLIQTFRSQCHEIPNKD